MIALRSASREGEAESRESACPSPARQAGRAPVGGGAVLDAVQLDAQPDQVIEHAGATSPVTTGVMIASHATARAALPSGQAAVTAAPSDAAARRAAHRAAISPIH